jgi:phenazine biosynthesis protein phzE
MSDDRGECLFTEGDIVRRASGALVRCDRVADIPQSDRLTIALVPFSQIRERDFETIDDRAQILALVCDDLPEEEAPASEDLAPVVVSGVEYVPSDEEFAERVQQIVDREISRGEGSNFLLARQARFTIDGFTPALGEQLFWRLRAAEPNAYRAFCFRAGAQHWIGASPERNVTVRDGAVVMNPICGTLPLTSPVSAEDLRRFLLDPKEIHELFQVLDEELKMMANICEEGGRVIGPQLKRMASVLHTEYELEGRTALGPLEVFERSMFAPTMIGSPLKNAARIVAKYETVPRGYYSAAIVFLNGPASPAPGELDSAITIRTVHVAPDGAATVFSGASIVRDSSPEAEVREVNAKADAVVALLRDAGEGERRRPAPPLEEPWVDSLLSQRNDLLSPFWLSRQEEGGAEAASGEAVILDFDDDFSWMLRHMLRHLGLSATVLHWERFDPDHLDGADLVALGPGPGDPSDRESPKMDIARRATAHLLAAGSPFLAVCLSHQVLCQELGFAVLPLSPSLQGVQRRIDFFGRTEHVGLYNTFAATAAGARPSLKSLEVCADPEMIYALRGPTFESFQFHVESVLTTGGMQILRDAVTRLQSAAPSPRSGV